MEHPPANLLKALETAAPASVELLSKPMFGGIMAYAHGRAFCSLSNVGLALKLSAEERETLLKVKGAKPLQYEPDAPPSKSYVVVPDAMLKDKKTLGGWIAKSAAFVKSEPAKKPKKKKAAKA